MVIKYFNMLFPASQQLERDDMDNITVRPVKEADVETVIALDRQASGFSRRGFYEKRFAAAQANPNGFVWLIALQGGKLAGFISAHILNGEFGGGCTTAVLDAIGTAPEMRGQGIGRTLIASLEGELRARKVSELHSEADWTEQNLVSFFSKSGFHLAPQLVLECACQVQSDF